MRTPFFGCLKLLPPGRSNNGSDFKLVLVPPFASALKLLYANKESVTIPFRKFQAQKNVKIKKGPITVSGFMKLVQRFEEIIILKNHAGYGRPSLRKECL